MGGGEKKLAREKQGGETEKRAKVLAPKGKGGAFLV